MFMTSLSGTSPAMPIHRTEYPRSISPPMTHSTFASRSSPEPLGHRRWGASQRQTRWFYERARGQYQDAKVAESTPAKRRVFSAEHPTRQRFSKTDLAKFENTWGQLPHIVSRGAQKNFSDYMIRLGERDRTVVDRAHFERLVAKAILFQTTERIVQRENFGGYRANIVTYTLALLSNSTSQRLDLERIWREQTLTENLQEVIAELSRDVHGIITNPPTARNITEWCKTEKCWEVVRDSASRAPVERLRDELLDLTATRREQRHSMAAHPFRPRREPQEGDWREPGGLDDARDMGNGDKSHRCQPAATCSSRGQGSA